jgi:hypothetical protein
MVGIGGTVSLLALSVVKQACYTAASLVTLDWLLLRRRNTSLAAAETQTATELLQSIEAVTLPM